MNDENAVQNLQNGESNEDIKASLRPWSRYFAKSIDSVILFFIAGALFLVALIFLTKKLEKSVLKFPTCAT